MRGLITRLRGWNFSLDADGVQIVRNFFPQAGELRRAVLSVYDNLSRGDIADHDLIKNYTEWNGVVVAALPAHLKRTDAALAETMERLFEAISDSTKSRFGSIWHMLQDRSYFCRRKSDVPWHIDADAAALHMAEAGCFNVWLPLEPEVGRRIPSLDVVPRSHIVMRKMPLLKGHPHPYRDDPFVAEIGSPISPVLRLGDALIFDQYTLHRTQSLRACSGERLSCEFRFR
jgi:hypothetical protein